MSSSRQSTVAKACGLGSTDGEHTAELYPGGSTLKSFCRGEGGGGVSGDADVDVSAGVVVDVAELDEMVDVAMSLTDIREGSFDPGVLLTVMLRAPRAASAMMPMSGNALPRRRTGASVSIRSVSCREAALTRHPFARPALPASIIGADARVANAQCGNRRRRQFG
jgi:hypothetical protein